MLTADVRVEEFDVTDWLALTGLLARAPSPRGRSGGLFVVLDQGRVAKAWSTVKGRLAPGDAVLSGPLADAAERHGARWAARLERRVVPHVVDGFAVTLTPGDDMFAQAMKFVEVLRELSEAGAVETYPRDFRRLHAKERLLRRLVDVLCPVGKTLLFGAFDRGSVSTSVALHRRKDGFDRVVGPATVRREMGLVSGDFSRDARGLARAVELSVGPLALGCFAEVHVFHRLLADATPGAWASAVAAREVVFHPLAPALAIPLGVDVGRAAVAVARDWAGRLGVSSLFGDASPLRPALDRVRDLSGSAEIERRLGFDPVAMLSELFGQNR